MIASKLFERRKDSSLEGSRSPWSDGPDAAFDPELRLTNSSHCRYICTIDGYFMRINTK